VEVITNKVHATVIGEELEAVYCNIVTGELFTSFFRSFKDLPVAFSEGFATNDLTEFSSL